VTTTGAAVNGIDVTGAAGDINITVDGEIIASQTGIALSSTTGDITVGGTGNVTGSSRGVDISSTSGNIRVDDLAVVGGIWATGTTGTVGITATSTGGYFISGDASVAVVSPGGTISSIGVGGVETDNTGTGTIDVFNHAAINSAGDGIKTNAEAGFTFIEADADVTGGTNGVNATAISGGISVVNIATVTGPTNAITGTTSGQFDIENQGTISGLVNVAGSNVSTSDFINVGTWNTGVGSSQFSGSLTNHGPLNMQNGAVGDTVSLGGNLTNDGDVTIDVNASGQNDKILATGTATLSGGVVGVLAAGGSYAPSTTYTILTALGGVSGTFADVTTNLAFLDPSLTYDSNNVFLRLVRNDISFVSVAQTPNQRAVAGALEDLDPSSALVFAIFSQTAGGAQQAFDALSGEVHASVAGLLIDQSHFLSDAILARLLQASHAGGGTTNLAALGGGAPTVAALGGAPMMGLGMGAGAKTPAATSTGLVAWTQGFGSWGDFDSDGNAAAADRTVGGFISGIDAELGGGWRAGFAGGYTQTSASVDARLSSADIESYHLAAYAGGNLVGSLALRGGGVWTWHDIETDRTILFPGFLQQAEASYDGDTGQVFGELALPFSSAGAAVEPFGRLAYVHFGTDGFTESGGIAALTAGDSSDDMTYSMLGLRAAGTMTMAGTDVTPHVSAAWQHAFGDVTTDMALAFNTGGAGFIISGVPIARDSALLEAGLNFEVAEDATLGVSYQGQLSSDVRDHGVNGRLDWRF
jgi:outer membrane autotransporter protein